MCNLYSVTKGQQAIREAFRAMTDRTGTLPPLPAIFPEQMAPVVRHGADGRELAMLLVKTIRKSPGRMPFRPGLAGRPEGTIC